MKVKCYLSFLPAAPQDKFFSLLPFAKKWAVRAFCVLHVLAVIWWLIPGHYGQDVRIAPAFNWLSQGEEHFIYWKQVQSANRSFFIEPLENYAFVSTSYQSWRMFAPNPINVQSWLAAYPVTGWRNLAASEELPEGTPWKERRVPIYDLPNFRGYEGELVDRMQGAPLFYGYGFKISEGVLGWHGVEVLRSIADYSLRRYLAANHPRPLGFHVLRLTAPVVPEFNLPREKRATLKSSVVFFHHY